LFADGVTCYMNTTLSAVSEPVQAAAASTLSILPATWPQPNALTVFGILLSFGVLGGLLAARARWLPSITGFMVLGLLIGPSGLGLLTGQALTDSRVLVDIALGLILFKLGSTLHPIKAARDKRLVVTSLVEGIGTFIAVLALMVAVGSPPIMAALAAAIAVSSSPAVLIHVSEELHASGPTINHAQSLVAINNVLSFVLFSLSLPFALATERVELTTALLLPAYQMAGAVLIAIAVAWLAVSIAKLTRPGEEHFRFALVVGAVMATLGLAQIFQASTLFAGLSLGIACRWMQGRTRIARVEFGGGGDVFFVILFVFAGANLHLSDVVAYAPVALALVAVRTLVKMGSVYGVGRGFGTERRSALAGGMLLVPMAGLAIGLVQTTTQLMPELGARIAAIVLAAVAVFETIGPPLAAFALRFCGDAGRARQRGHGRGAHGEEAVADSELPTTAQEGESAPPASAPVP
jgi:Kef-type K+ transport system membrane component KefB